MARHKVAEYEVEVTHHSDRSSLRSEIIVTVYLNGELVEFGRMDRMAFNSMELRRKVRVLERFSVHMLDAVIEDAMEDQETSE